MSVVRSTMLALILRVRSLIADPAGPDQTFRDDEIQDVLDASRQDGYNLSLKPQPTFTGSLIEYLDYFGDLSDYEGDFVLKQFLTVVVTPASVELIPGHFHFATSTLPPVYLTGKIYDIYCAAADLLERQSAQWALRYSMSVDGQSFQRNQAFANLQALARSYRAKQRPRAMTMVRTGMAGTRIDQTNLGPTAIDYMSSGNGNGR